MQRCLQAGEEDAASDPLDVLGGEQAMRKRSRKPPRNNSSTFLAIEAMLGGGSLFKSGLQEKSDENAKSDDGEGYEEAGDEGQHGKRLPLGGMVVNCPPHCLVHKAMVLIACAHWLHDDYGAAGSAQQHPRTNSVA